MRIIANGIKISAFYSWIFFNELIVYNNARSILYYYYFIVQ